MYLLKSSSFRYFVLILIVTTGLSGCEIVPPLREETFTFTPGRTASIFGSKVSETFGICGSTVDRRGTRLYLWDEFIRQRDRATSDYSNSHLSGYEVAVSRGETCHLRILDTFQAAVWFNLSSLPSTAVVSAELRISDVRYGGLDAPRGIGGSDRCKVARVGEATQAWVSGI